MPNIINFPQQDLTHCSYTEINNTIGVAIRDSSLELFDDGDIWQVQFTTDEGNKAALGFTREELAEFLHVASALVDSEGRHIPPFELIGKDY